MKENEIGLNIIIVMLAIVWGTVLWLLVTFIHEQMQRPIVVEPTAEVVEVEKVERTETGEMITLNINGELHDYYYEY